MRKLIVGVVVLLGVVAALTYAFRGELAMRVAGAAIERSMAEGRLATLPDGLHLALCGAGAPMPDAVRSGPCVAVIAGRSLYVVDAGSGGARNLQRMGFTPGDVQALLLTHFHSDHIDGLGELALLRWTTGSHESPLPVYGPSGVESVVEGFNAAYRLDFGYRTAHHGPEVAPPGGAGSEARAFAVPAEGEGHVVLRADGLVITAFTVPHEPATPSVGYRFDYGGRALLVSGDSAESSNLTQFADGVDLLAHEALAPHLVALVNRSARNTGRGNLAQIAHDILDYHTTPVQAARIAATAGARHLLYYHILPPLPVPGLEAAFVDGVAAVYDGPVTVGRDGTFVSLPSQSDAIRVSTLM